MNKHFHVSDITTYCQNVKPMYGADVTQHKKSHFNIAI